MNEVICIQNKSSKIRDDTVGKSVVKLNPSQLKLPRNVCGGLWF